MPTFTHGKNARVFTNGYDLSGFLNSITVSGEAETAEVTTLGLDDKTYIPGLKDATLSAEGFYAGAESEVDDLMVQQLGTTTLWTTLFSPDAVGGIAYLAQVVNTSYEVGAEIGGAVAVTIEGQVTGGREAGRVLAPHTSRTATGSAAGVNNGAATTGGLAAYLHVTAASGTTPNLVVKVQHSTDGSAWVDLATFTAVTAANQYQRVAVSGTVNQYLRAYWTITGTSPAFTFHVAAARI